MTLEAYIKRLEALNLSAAEIFEHITSAIETTKDTMLEHIQAGSVDVSNAILNGLEISYDNIRDNHPDAAPVVNNVPGYRNPYTMTF